MSRWVLYRQDRDDLDARAYPLIWQREFLLPGDGVPTPEQIASLIQTLGLAAGHYTVAPIEGLVDLEVESTVRVTCVAGRRQ